MSRGLKFGLVIVIAIATNAGLRMGFGHKYCSQANWDKCYQTGCQKQEIKETAK